MKDKKFIETCEICCNNLSVIESSLDFIEFLIDEMEGIEKLIELFTKDVFIMSMTNAYEFKLCLNCGFFKFNKLEEFENLTQNEIIDFLDKKQKDKKLKLYAGNN